ncbi:type VI secretion system tube protein Hcp [Jannaschia seohaensis]|uniref:Ca2+-binding RTX toxin-like protein n=1 Tax=Jannaschia seohaensis TaxID=475081 RepID=A0A2Y9AXX3_9RHOB|nr:type VI secretion system tube protein Hcp [Jannaschia seohaensis]PWJ16118.1 Ca2+-binding RTX toxin-like protein [Jannaschia seohaensis]SSA48976.1 Ca2+-binding protein, RTX toxin-related [Jannaschia seohaensis]
MSVEGFLTFTGGDAPLEGTTGSEGREGAFALFDLDFGLGQAIDVTGDVLPQLASISVELSREDGARAGLVAALEGDDRFDEAKIEIVRRDAKDQELAVQTFTLGEVGIAAYREELNTNIGVALTFEALTIETFQIDPVGQSAKLANTLTFDPDDAEAPFLVSTSPPGTDLSAIETDTQAFLVLDGINGSSVDKVQSDDTDVFDSVFDVFREGDGVAVAPLAVDISPEDKAGPLLLKQTITGASIARVDLLGRVSDLAREMPTNDLVLNLPARAIVSSFTRDDDFATHVGFRPAGKLEFSTTPVVEDGKFGAKVDAAIDLARDSPNEALPDGFASTGVPLGSPAGNIFLTIDGIDGPGVDAPSAPDDAFALAGFGYAILSGTAETDLKTNAGGGRPQFTPLTVDFEALGHETAELFSALLAEREFAAVTVIRTNEDGVEAERIALKDAVLTSLSTDSVQAPRATFGFEAISFKSNEILESGEIGAKQKFDFSVVEQKQDLSLSPDVRGAELGFATTGPREAGPGDALQHFLRADGINGDSQNRNFKDDFDVDGYRFDMFRDAEGATLPALAIELDLDTRNGVKLAEEATQGKSFASVLLQTTRGVDGEDPVVSSFKLDKARILDVEETSGATATVLLGYDEIEGTFFSLDETGGAVESATFTATPLAAPDQTFEGGAADVPGFDGADEAGAIFMKIGDFEGASEVVEGKIGKDFTDHFVVDSLDFRSSSELAVDNSGDTPKFQSVNPTQSLTVDLRPGQLGELDLLDALAKGTVLPEVEIVAFDGASLLSDRTELTLTDARIASVDIGAERVTRLSFDYEEAERTRLTVNPETGEAQGNVPTFFAFTGDFPGDVVIRSGPAERGSFLTQTFLDFQDNTLSGPSVVEGFEGQFDVFDWTLEMAKLAGIADAADAPPEGVELAPLEVVLPAFTPGVMALLDRTRDGSTLPNMTLSLATPAVDRPPEPFDVYTFSNVSVLNFAQSGELVELELGYSLLNRQLRELNKLGEFEDFEGTIDFRTDDRVLGGDGADLIRTGGGADFAFGGAGDDSVDTGEGDDEIEAGSGAGDDSYEGGEGTDLITYRSTELGIVLDLAAGLATGSEIETDTLSGIENAVLGAGADSGIGDALANALEGGAGEDTLEGGDGDDTLDGGSEEDVASYQTAPGGVAVDLGLGTATGAAGDDVLIEIEHALGGAFADRLTGSDGANMLMGGDGDDTLEGGLGADTLMLEGGSDEVRGTLLDFDSDLIGDLTGDDTIFIQGADLGPGDIRIFAAPDILPEGSVAVRFAPAGAEAAETTLLLEGELTSALFRLDQAAEGAAALRLGAPDALDALLTDAAERFDAGPATLIDAAGGNDTITSSVADATVVGGAGDDDLTGDAAPQLFVGGAGADTITTGDGPDRVLVRSDDATPGTPERDVIADFGSDDVLHLFGFDLDLLFDLGLAVTEEGLLLRPSDDQEILLQGFFLEDARRTSLSTEDIALPILATASDAAIAPAVVGGGLVLISDDPGDQRLVGTEEDDILGTGAGNDELSALDGDDDLAAAAGNDTLLGGGGDDTLRGGAGADLLDGGEGRDRMEGGTGDDLYIVDNRGDVVRDEAGTDIGRVSIPSPFRVAETGLDRVEAADPETRLFVLGDAGATEMLGGATDDILVSGGGADTMTGGAGRDFFTFLRDGSTPNVTITDFDADDKLLLDDQFFGLGDAGIDLRPLGFSQVLALVRDGLASFDGRTRELSVDLDGADGPDGLTVIATFAQRPPLNADDVLLI